MLAEMYLDLLNITEGEKIPGRILSPLTRKLPQTVKRIVPKKADWNSDSKVKTDFNYNQTFKLNSTSMFDQPNGSGSNHSRSKSTKNKTRNQTINQKPSSSSKERIKTKIKQKTLDAVRNRSNHNRTFTTNAPDKKSVQIYRKKIKSPMNMLRALGIYKKSTLLDDVLKMYKHAAGDYNEYHGQDGGAFSDRRDEAGGRLFSNEHTTITDSTTKFVYSKNRTIQSPQPAHKRLYSPPVKIGGAKNVHGVGLHKTKRSYMPLRLQAKADKDSARARNNGL